MTILVTGARGAVGHLVLDGLLDAGVPAAQVRASGRDPRRLEVPDGVTAVGADLGERSSLAAAFDGVDQVFLLAPHGDTAPLAGALHQSAVTHVVVLSASVIDEPQGGALALVHQAAEDAIASTGVTMTALRPGAFADNALGWAAEIRERATVSTPYPDGHTAPIQAGDVADAAVAVLTGHAPHGAPIRLTGPQSLSFRDQVDILARELERDLQLVELTPDQERARNTSVPPAVLDTLLAIWAGAEHRPRTLHPAERITGRPGRSFAEWVRDHRASFIG